MSVATIEALDLSDLDLLDDEHEHWQCLICLGGQVVGTPVIAWCGRKTIRWEPVPEGCEPANLCPDCAKPGQCATCGTWSS